MEGPKNNPYRASENQSRENFMKIRVIIFLMLNRFLSDWFENISKMLPCQVEGK
jgi:hypothetical protein